MLEVLVLSAIILLICLILLSVNILLKKNGKFPSMHVGSNPTLRKKGIKCVRSQDFEAGIRKNLFERMQRET